MPVCILVIWQIVHLVASYEQLSKPSAGDDVGDDAAFSSLTSSVSALILGAIQCIAMHAEAPEGACTKEEI
ncbi:MAG: hypothetical protein CVV52_13905 [Spirochaetae bacterium HGW-Spirochaetae-8]|jgi:hypothetical protein|nr:MAG: hypothetical protein CVV52_13905 [Spirochaetae bacterium HGW-Spirochaetae-8]